MYQYAINVNEGVKTVINLLCGVTFHQNLPRKKNDRLWQSVFVIQTQIKLFWKIARCENPKSGSNRKVKNKSAKFTMQTVLEAAATFLCYLPGGYSWDISKAACQMSPNKGNQKHFWVNVYTPLELVHMYVWKFKRSTKIYRTTTPVTLGSIEIQSFHNTYFFLKTYL